MEKNTQQKNCQGCHHSKRCLEIYKKMSNTSGPSVAFKVVKAFLLPLLVFILILVLSEEILAKTMIKKEFQTGFNFLLALAGVFIVILAAKLITKWFIGNKRPQTF